MAGKKKKEEVVIEVGIPTPNSTGGDEVAAEVKVEKPKKKKRVLRHVDLTQEEIDKAERSPAQSRMALKRKVRLFYDLQRMRLQTSGRLHHVPREGEEPNEGKTPDIELHIIDQKILGNRAAELHQAEKNALGDIKDHLKLLPFYNDVLSDKVRFRGVGPTMAGVILAEFDINRLDTVSKMWAFAGLAPIAARRCSGCHLVVELTELGYKHPKVGECASKGGVIPEAQTYASGKAMRPTKGEKLKYNAMLRSKLCGVLGSVLLQVNSPWRKCYDDYRNRKRAQNWGYNDQHRHKAATRYMIKMLLLEIWKAWREHAGLPVRPPYAEEFLGHKHVGGTTANNQDPVAIESDIDVSEELKLLDA